MNKFSEGEIVILQSGRFPHYNGEYTVSRVYSNPEEIFACRLTGTPLRVNLVDKYSYHFDIPLGDDNGREICFLESSLRKKHNPSSMSYQELMTNLSTKIQERI